MKIVAVGDLHARRWDWWAPAKDGRNGYLALLQHYLLDHVVKVAEYEHADEVLFLGDLMDEPNATGKTGVVELACVVQCIEELRSRGQRVRILLGNHDVCGGGAAWTDAFPGVPVIAEPRYEGGIAYIPHAPLKSQIAALDEAERQGCQVVFGHFVYSGALLDNGLPYNESACIPSSYSEKFRLSVLGHAHTPAVTTAAVYTGSALRYSWSQRDTAPRMLHCVDSCGGGYTSSAFPCPSFVGPTSDLTLLSGLAPGSYVRYEVPEGGSDLLKQVKAQYPALHVIPVLCPARVNAVAPRLEVGGGKDEEARVAALRSYVCYASNAGVAPVGVDPTELLDMGKTFIGGAK